MSPVNSSEIPNGNYIGVSKEKRWLRDGPPLNVHVGGLADPLWDIRNYFRFNCRVSVDKCTVSVASGDDCGLAFLKSPQ
jgi:hypothetical protein